MITVKRTVTIILALALFMASSKFWRFILINDSGSYTRIMMHEMYTASKNIDVLFVGSSHVYRSLIPDITDKGFGAYTFNAGSSNQYMDGSLAIIKEASKKNHLKSVYLELYYGIAEGPDYKERTELTSTYIISDYMPLSLNKIQYLTHASSNEHWINSFLIARRNWKFFFDSDYVKDVIASKQTDQYKNFVYQKGSDDIEYYVERGFVANDGVVKAGFCFNKTAYKNIGVGTTINKGGDWATTIAEIADYCKKNGIKLSFFITPEPEWTLVGNGNYQEYHNLIADIANELNVDFMDFNLCKNKYFDANDPSLFKDEDHLNTTGAKKFSLLFSDVATGKLDSKQVLYNSFDSKIKDADNPFYGIAGPVNDEDGNRKCRIISGSEHFEYTVTEDKNDGSQLVLKSNDKTKDFIIPAEATGTITIACKDLRTGVINIIKVDIDSENDSV